MVLVHLGCTTDGLVVLAVRGEESLALLVQEDIQGLQLGGVVDAHSGDVTTLADRFFEVSQVLELASLG